MRRCFQTWVVVFNCFLGCAAAVGADDRDAPFPIDPAAGIDEPLFLVRAAENLYAQWPRNLSDTGAVQGWLVHSRAKVARLQAVIRVRGFDANLARLYDDCGRMIDVYETYLGNIGAIDRALLRQAQEDSKKAGEAALAQGFDTADRASKEGEGAGTALGAGVVTGILKGAFEDYRLRQARDDARRAAMDAEMRKLTAAWTKTLASAEILAEELTRKQGWKEGEAGFDNFSSKRAADYLTRRPRDPFLRVHLAQSHAKDATAADYLEAARRCLAAAKQVPAGKAYDVFRTEFALAAAEQATHAASLDLKDTAYSNAPAASSADAVRFCRTLLACDSADASRMGHLLLARALGSAGRFNEAIGAANLARDKWGNDPWFAYRYVRLMSLTGQTNHAEKWLVHAYRCGFSQIDFLRKDPDMANLRRALPKRYEELTAKRLTWSIDYGILNDDIIITNQSPFPLTNVRVEIVIRKGDRTWKPVLKAATLRPGASERYTDIVSIPGSAYDEAAATLYCDQ